MPQPSRPQKRTKRRKTGCTRCRASHTKCDEVLPRCGRCERLDLECEPSNFIIPSDWCPGKQSETTGAGKERTNPTSTWDVFNNSVTPLPTISSSREEPLVAREEPLSLDAEKVTLIRKYQNGIGTWVDLFDNNANFVRTAVKRSITSPLLMNAICALTARQLSMVSQGGAIWEAAATRYYGESLRHLINSLVDTAAAPEDALAATILLSSYELLVSPGLDHRRHVSGALTLIRTYECKANSKSLMGASFWVYARQDVAMALVHERSTMLPPEEWGACWNENEAAEDRLGNQMIWLIAKSIAFTYGQENDLSLAAIRQKRASLFRATRAWYNSLPASFHGISYGHPSPAGFVKYWFAVPLTAAAMCMYHLSQILLLCEGCNTRATPDDRSKSDLQEHAHSIASICFSPISDGALVQGVQPLYYAAKHIDSFTKKVKICSLLDRIETQLGFHTGNRVTQLQDQVQMK